MKTNVILKTMFVLLFVCGSAVITNAGQEDAFRDGHFEVIYELKYGLLCENDNGLMQRTRATVGPNAIAMTYCYNATPWRYYNMRAGSRYSVRAVEDPYYVIFNMMTGEEEILVDRDEL